MKGQHLLGFCHHTHVYRHFSVCFLAEMRRMASPWQRNLGYPLAMLTLLALTVLAFFINLIDSAESSVLTRV